MGNELKRCCIVSGSPSGSIDFLKNRIENYSYIIAADFGYTRLSEIGLIPDLIIGDFDSAPKPHIDCEILTFPVEKAYSDTYNCVMEAISRGYKNIDVFFSVGGNRFDHTYSNLLILDYCRRHGAVCRLIDENIRLSLIERELTFKREYEYFSLFAYLCDCYGVTINGAYYTQDFYDKPQLDIMRYDAFAQSNYIIGDACTVKVQKGVLLLVESND